MYALSGRVAAVGVAALTTADNDFICVPNGRRWQVSEKKKGTKMTGPTPKIQSCRLILHTYGEDG